MVVSRWQACDDCIRSQVKEEIVEIVRLIPQRSAFGSVPWSRLTTHRATGRGRNGGSGPDHSPGAYLRVYHWLNRRCASGGATPSTDCPDSSEDTGARPRLSGRRARCDAAKSANVTRHRVCLRVDGEENDVLSFDEGDTSAMSEVYAHGARNRRIALAGVE